MPRDRLLEKLGATHIFVWIIAGPEDLGWPTSRERFLGVLISRKRWRWLGPTEPEQILEDFRSRFFKTRALCGDQLFFDSDENRWQHYTEIVNSRPGQKHHGYTTDELRALPSWELLMLMGIFLQTQIENNKQRNAQTNNRHRANKK